MLRRIPFDKIENFRDVGGYYATYGETQFGVIFRSGTLADATENDKNLIIKMGIRYILDLRHNVEGEEKDSFVDDDRFIVKNVRVKQRKNLARTSFELENEYLDMLSDKKSAKQVFLSLAYAPKPMLVHCKAGKDRTGIFLAILLLFNGVPFHDVNADYMISTPYLTRLQRVTLKILPNFPKAILSPDSGFLKGVLRRFYKKYKTIENYFKEIGLVDKDIIILKNLLGVHINSITLYPYLDKNILLEKGLRNNALPRIITNQTLLPEIEKQILSDKGLEGKMLLPAVKTKVTSVEKGKIYKSETLCMKVNSIKNNKKYIDVKSYNLNNHLDPVDYKDLDFADKLIEKELNRL